MSTTAKHRASAPPRRDQAASRHPAPQPGAGLCTSPAWHSRAEGTWVPSSHPPAPPASINPHCCRQPAQGWVLLGGPQAMPGGHLGIFAARVPGPHAPPPQPVAARSRWVPSRRGCPGQTGARGSGCRNGGCLDLGWLEQGVSGRAWCGPCPALQARAKGSALACHSYSWSSGASRKSSHRLFPGGL